MATTEWLDNELSNGQPTAEPAFSFEQAREPVRSFLPEYQAPTPDWRPDVYERVSKSAQESFGSIWAGLGLLADSIGMENARDWALNRSNELFDQAASHDIVTTQFSEISNPIDLAKFTAEKVIEYIPDLALMFAGGAGFGTAAEKTALTTVGKGAAETFAKKALSKNLGEIAVAAGKTIADKSVQEAAYKATLKQMGQLVGMASVEGFQGAGQMYSKDVMLNGVEEASPLAAGLGGVAQAAVAMVSPFNQALSKIAFKKGIKSYLEMTLGEATEEVLQGGVEKLHEAGVDPYLTVGEVFSDPKTYADLAEAGIVGAIVGGAYGGAGQAVFGTEGDRVQNPDDVGLIDVSPTPNFTPVQQQINRFNDQLVAFYQDQKTTTERQPAPGEVTPAPSFRTTTGALPEAAKTTDQLLAEYEAVAPPTSPEVEKLRQMAIAEKELASYQPVAPVTEFTKERTTAEQETKAFEKKAQEDTYNSWFDRFAPDTIREKEISSEIAKKMAEVEQDSNNVRQAEQNLPTNLTERNKARIDIAKQKADLTNKVNEVISKVEQAPTKEEIAKAQEQVDLAETMANVPAGIQLSEKGADLISATVEAPAEAKKLIEERKAVKLPETTDPDIKLILDNNVDGLIQEIRSYKNPEGAYVEIAEKAGKFVDANPEAEQQVIKVLKEVYDPATKREGAAKTGAYKWEVNEGIAETSNPKTKETYRVLPVGEDGFILVDKTFTKLSTETYPTSIAARRALETIVPIAKEVQVAQKAAEKKVKKAEQAKKKSVKEVTGRVPKEQKKTEQVKVETKPVTEKITEEKKSVDKLGYPIVEETKQGFKSVDGNYTIKKEGDIFVTRFKNEEILKSFKAEDGQSAIKYDSTLREDYDIKPQRGKVFKSQTVREEVLSDTESIQEKEDNIDKIEDIYSQINTSLNTLEKKGAAFTPTTLGEGFAKVADYLSGNKARLASLISTNAKGKFEDVKMYDIASFPEEERVLIEKKLEAKGLTGKESKITGAVAPIFDENGKFQKWMLLYDSRNMTDLEVVNMMLHEGLHTVTINELESNPKFNDQVTRLRKYTINQLVSDPLVRKELSKVTTTREFLNSPLVSMENSEVLYSLINNAEFLTGANIEESFRKEIKKIKAPKSSSLIKNVWDTLKSFFGKVLGINTKDAMLLDEILNVTEKVIKTVPTNFVTKENLHSQYIGTISEVESKTIEKKSSEREQRDREFAQKNKVKLHGVETKTKNFLDNSWKLFKDLFATTSERVRYNFPKVFHAMRNFEFRVHRKNLHHMKLVDSFLRKINDLPAEDEFVLTKALFNGDAVNRDNILSKFNLEKDFEKVQEVLKDIEQRADAVGLLDEKVKNYFPRSVKDPEGLISHFKENPEEFGFVQYEIEQAEKKAGYSLSEADKNNIVVNILTSGNYNHIPRPGSSKARNISYVPRELVKYYHTISDSLLDHIVTMNDSIETRVTLGKSDRPKKMRRITTVVSEIEKLTDKEKLTKKEEESLDNLRSEYESLYEEIRDKDKELENSIGKFIREKSTGKGSAEEAISLMRARFKQRGTYGAVSTARNIAYAISLGSPTSAITQIGDLTWSIYRNNPLNTLKGAARAIRAMIDKGGLTQTEFDFGHALQEMSGVKSAKMLDKILTWTGLKGMDIFAKETAMQSSLEKWSKDRDGFIKDHTEMFGGKVEAAKVWADIKNGKKTEDVLLAVFNDLSDWQPISLFEMPKTYLEAGNGRVFYMLKTFSIKALNSIHREVYLEYKKGNANEAGKKLVGLITALSLSGATADELKDWLLGKDTDVKDHIIDNFFQLFLLNKYSAVKGLKEDTFISNMVDGLVPPVRFADDFVADLYAAASKDKDFKFKSLKNVPIVGKVAWSYSEWGTASDLNNRRSDIYELIRESVSGDVSNKEIRDKIKTFNKKVREFNVGKKQDDRIKPVTSTNIKNVKRRERKKEKE